VEKLLSDERYTNRQTSIVTDMIRIARNFRKCRTWWRFHIVTHTLGAILEGSIVLAT